MLNMVHISYIGKKNNWYVKLYGKNHKNIMQSEKNQKPKTKYASIYMKF
jgi:hypothetical protein